jgi:hypothetical protein
MWKNLPKKIRPEIPGAREPYAMRDARVISGTTAGIRESAVAAVNLSAGVNISNPR